MKEYSKYHEKALEMSNDIIENRRTIHNFAEIGFELPKTISYVQEKLREYGQTQQMEDFTAVANLVPSVMLKLGAGSIKEGYALSMHNPGMIVDENALFKGTSLYAYCAEQYLNDTSSI